MKRMCKPAAAVAAIVIFSQGASARSFEVTSPDNSLKVEVADNGGNLSWSLRLDSITLLDPSPLGMKIDGVMSASIKSGKLRKGISETIDAPLYRQSRFTVNYNELDLKLAGAQGVTFRVYNDGVAYRFNSSVKHDVTVDNELIKLDIPRDVKAYLPYSTNDDNPFAMAYQNIYDITQLSSAKEKLAFLPLTLDYGHGVKMTVLESDLRSYPGMFMRADTTALTLEGVFAPYPSSMDLYPWRMQSYVTATEPYIARTEGSRSFPWRIFAVTADDRLMPVNNLVYALAEPSKVADVSWIKPGKVAWDWWNDWGLSGVPFKAGINMDTYKYYIDFASEKGIEYVVLDEGWYDPKSGDMMTVIDDINLPELIAYASDRGVGIVLWTVFNVLDDVLEEACQKYAAMGVKGFKVDFLDRDDQTAVEMTHRIAEAAARHNLMLDYHGIYKPVGLSRTYPNVVNYEGVFGMEEVKWTDFEKNMPLYDVIFPYIRMMAGQVDYTPGAMTNATSADWKAIYYNPMSMGTRCHQLATYIVHDSPFTMLCDSPTNYKGEDECVDFIAALPTVFDHTEIIDGIMGSHIVTARSKGDDWYVGGLTSWEPRDLKISFSFLPEGKSYRGVLFTDGVNADKQGEDYTRRVIDVDSTTVIDMHLASGGGFAMTLTEK